MKKIIIGISLVLVTLSLCGCSTTNNDSEILTNQDQYIENEDQNNLEENLNKEVDTQNKVNTENKNMSGENLEVIPIERR